MFVAQKVETRRRKALNKETTGIRVKSRGLVALTRIVQPRILSARNLDSASANATSLEMLSAGAKEIACVVQTKEEQPDRKEEQKDRQEEQQDKKEEEQDKKEEVQDKKEEVQEKKEELRDRKEEEIKKKGLVMRKGHAPVMQIVQALIQFAQSLASVNVSVTNQVSLSAGVRDRPSVVEEMSGKKRMLQWQIKNRKTEMQIIKEKIRIKKMFPKKIKPATLIWRLLMTTKKKR